MASKKAIKSVDKKFIGLDLDGVIVDHTLAKIKLAKNYGFSLKPHETHPDIIKTIIKDPVLREIKRVLYEDPDFYKSSILINGAKDGLALIKKQNLPFVLISRRKNPKTSIQVLKFHKLWPKYFNSKNTFFVLNPEDKNTKAKEFGVTHYVDDQIGVLEKLVDVKNKFLFDNLGAIKNSDGYIRIKSWKELIDHCLK